jgi:hypothetical protein
MRKAMLVIAALLVLGAAACEKSRNNTSWSTGDPDSSMMVGSTFVPASAAPDSSQQDHPTP